MELKNENSIIDIFDSIVDSTDELIKYIRSSKLSNAALIQVLDRVVVFMGEIIKLFPDMMPDKDEKSPLQKLNSSYKLQRDALKNISSNSVLFYLQWHNFKLQWNNYIINYHITDLNERAFFISLN
jgi:hypothetical protein